jgi:hypothetical protein
MSRASTSKALFLGTDMPIHLKSLEADPQEKISESGNGYQSTSLCGDYRVGFM